MSSTEVALRVDLYIHDERASVPALIPKLEAIMSALDELRAEVAQSRDVTDSAIALLQGLKAQLDEAIATGDPGALVELAEELGSQTDRLAEAVAANTPQPGTEPELPPEEPPVDEPLPEDPPPEEPPPSFLATNAAPVTARRRR